MTLKMFKKSQKKNRLNISSHRSPISNLLVVLHMLLNYKFYLFLIRLYKSNQRNKTIGFYSYLRFLLKFNPGEKIIYFNKQYVINSFLPPILSEAFFTFVHSLSKDNDIFSSFAKGSSSAPISTYLKLTNECNCNCFHCSAGYQNKNKKKLSTGDWKKIISDLQALGTSYIGFTGGEPLLHEDLEEIIASVDKRSVTILFTNGIHLTYEKALSLKKAGLFALSVSLDSAIEERHNEIRGNKNAFSAALQAIHHARKAGLYTIVQSVLFKEELNQERLYPLLKLIKKQGAHEVRIHQPAIAGKLLDSVNQDQILFTESDRQKMFDLQFKANKKLFGFPKVISFPYTEGPEQFGCNAGIFHSYVTDEGELTPCDFVPLSFGNILENDLAESYKKMHQIVGKRKMSCMAMQIVPYMSGKKTPISIQEATQICKAVYTEEEPKVFKDYLEMLKTKQGK